MATNPMPYTFGTATSAIPLSQLDTNFATPVTLGNTAVYLNNTYSSIGNLTLANVTITSGTVTITNVSVTTANVSGTANISTLVVTANASVAGNVTVSGNTVVTGNVTSATHILTGGTANGVVYLDTTKALTTGSALVFDGTNLGVGVTPSAWNTTTAVTALQLPNGSLMTYSNAYGFSNLYLSANAYLNSSGNWIYTKTNSASLYQQTDRQHAWLYANSGTAGTAITFTQAMTLDASGNLLLGATSARGSSKLDIRGDVMTLGSNANFYATIDYNAGAGLLSLASESGGGITFKSGTTERARIDTSGNLLVGTTTASGKIFAVNDASSARQCIRGDQSYDGAAAIYGRHTVNSATGFCAYFTNSGSGTGLYIANTAAWQSTSDARLKTDVQDLDSTARLMQLRPVDYLWKNQATSNEPTKRSFGFIAQEVKEIFPELVGVSPDGMLSVEYTGLIAPLVKAIQEQQSIIQSLTARITALEGA